MRIKIKARPEDFIVEEIAALPLVKKGDFAVYLLKKKGWNTVDLLFDLSRSKDIPFSLISYGGKKDRHSLSSQYIAIKNRKNLELAEGNYSLKFVGFMERPMGPDLIQANHFKIAVRDLKPQDIEACREEIESVQAQGYANYFDDQRFGCFDVRQGFLAAKALKGEFNGALKVYLTATYSQDTEDEKKKKRFFFENWKDWDACNSEASTQFEKKVFSYLINHPKGFLDLLKSIPREELSVHIAALQSYLWNQMLKKIIMSFSGRGLRAYPGLAGEYVFYSQLSQDDYLYLDGLDIAVPGAQAKFTDKNLQEIYAQVLKAEGLKNSVFNNWKLRRAYFKSFQRKSIVMPQGILSPVALEDELYSGKKKLMFEFSLARGSYATMFLKRIFSEDYIV
ncbi:MAG: tRNA pseudouridine(13) synthase TruD [Candidatus Omnitrophica bacterium]|nr:tRNA pseudouridine(13) synthase TruD [Candidatus Omnitrophota bacterium]